MRLTLWYRYARARFRKLAQGPYAVPVLGGGAILESSVVPFPYEVVFIPAILSAPHRVWTFCTAAFVGCLIAASAFYGLGLWFFEAIGADILTHLGVADQLQAFSTDLQTQGFWLIFLTSLLPAPIQIATIGSGLVGYPFWSFLAAIALSRLIRFYGLGLAVVLIGEQANHWMRRAEAHRRPIYGTVLVVLIAVVALNAAL